MAEAESRYPAALVGERIYLRALERTDLPLLQRWMNDPELRGLTGEVMPIDTAGVDKYYEQIRKDTHRVWFAIVRKDTHAVIGECGLLRMFYAWRNTDLSIILGEKSERGQGYGKEAILLLLDYAFGFLNFHRVSIGVVGFNTAALHFYDQIGFQREGIQRDGYYYDHAYSDFVMMSLLEDEYRRLWKPDSSKAK